MDIVLSSHLPEILVALAVAVFFHLRRLGNKKRRQHSVPEIPGALPLVGHLHLLRGDEPLARKLGSFADEHGAVFAIRLGANETVVVSDHESMKDCFTSNDRALAFRPDNIQAKILSYDYAHLGFASYGDYFRYIKKILMTEVLSVHRVKALRDIRISELDSLVGDLYQQQRRAGGQGILISEALPSYVFNIITRMVGGRVRYLDRDTAAPRRPIGVVMKEFMLVAGAIVPSDFIPILGWVGFQGPVKAMNRVFEELDVIMESWIDEHKKKPVSLEDDDDGGSADFIDVLLSQITHDVLYGHRRETIVKATALSLILGASDTTAIAVTWTLSNLLNHKRALKLAQEEIDSKVGSDRWVDDSDVDSLTYLRAVVKETIRMYPSGPLSLPREASEDVEIKGYRIRKGTRLLANYWKLHRDPKVWPDPDEFKPERFLLTTAAGGGDNSSSSVEIFGQQFVYLPFGSGRRGCPGINFAMQVTLLTVARLLQGFHWSTPGDKPVDMTEGQGATLPKVKPLEVVLEPRLSPRRYGA